jgi:hypothetical protein
MSRISNAWLDGDFAPLDGKVDVAAGPSWDQAALDNREAFDRSLRDAGFADGDVREALAVRDGIAATQKHIDNEIEQFYANTDAQFFSTPPEVEELYRRRAGAGQQLRNWYKGRTFQVDQVGDQEIRIPLFVVSAADEPGCTAQLEIGKETATEIGWTVTLFGTGLGGGGVIKASVRATFTCASGETKIVFVPVTARIEKVTLLEKGQEAGQGWRIDASRLQPAGAPGVRTLEAGSIVASGPLAETYPLTEDQTGAIANYSYKYEASTKIGGQIGLKVSGVDLSLKSQIELGQSLTLTFGLRAGFDYKLHLAKEGQGLVWAKAVAAPLAGRST